MTPALLRCRTSGYVSDGGTVRIFISWSKDRSKAFAQEIRDWLPEVIQEVEPWMSAEDIGKGKRWSDEIARYLDETSEGIVCVTADNMTEPWLHFEAGALAKSRADATVRPLLLDVGKADVVGPLAEFQLTAALDPEDMWLFVKSIENGCERRIGEERLRRAFDRVWPDLRERLDTLAATSAAAPKKAPSRRSEDMFAEVLDRIREIERLVTTPRGEPATPLRRRSSDEAIALAALIQPGWRVRSLTRGDGVVERVYLHDGQPFVAARYGDGKVFSSALVGPLIVSALPPENEGTE